MPLHCLPPQTEEACRHAAKAVAAAQTANPAIDVSWTAAWGSWDAAAANVSANPTLLIYCILAVALVVLLVFTIVRSGPELIKRLMILATCIILWVWLFPSFGAGRWAFW